MSILIDLHIHSTASDGTLTPTQIIQKAVQISGKKQPIVLALTDHDTVSGMEEFMKEAANYPQLITAIPGVEISAQYGKEEIHILGYHVDPKNPLLLEKLQLYRDSRDNRNAIIIKKLQEQGFQITLDDIKPEQEGDSIGRPLIAKHLLKMNYVSSIQEAFDKYLADGRCCAVDRIKPSPEEAVALIRESGGIAVLAHPVLYKKLDFTQKNQLFILLKDAGLIGVEAYYSRNTDTQTDFYCEVAKQYGLILTGGTDFHGENKPDLELFCGEGNLAVPENILDEFLPLIHYPMPSCKVSQE